AGTPEAAIAARIFAEVLLVIVLGVVELRCLADLRRDRAEPRRLQANLEALARIERGFLLRLAIAVDRGAIWRAAIVALPHSLRGVVAFPEHLQQVFIARLLRIER